MARITAGLAVSHAGALGVAMDLGKTREPYWEPAFKGFEYSRRWIAQQKPDVVILVYNDHAASISLDLVPTFVLGCADQFEPADEGWGRRSVPTAQGHPALAQHIAESLVLREEFDIAMASRLDVDHGFTVPLSLLFGAPDAWPCRVIPLAVNVLVYPQPTGVRCLKLGQAIRRAVESYDEDLNVMVWGTGGMSHQLQGERAGYINSEFDNRFLDLVARDPERASQITHLEYLRDAGSEGIELLMWLIMRGALSDQVREVHRHYHVPISNTALGHLILQEP